jgi:hypothetical protein
VIIIFNYRVSESIPEEVSTSKHQYRLTGNVIKYDVPVTRDCIIYSVVSIPLHFTSMFPDIQYFTYKWCPPVFWPTLCFIWYKNDGLWASPSISLGHYPYIHSLICVFISYGQARNSTKSNNPRGGDLGLNINELWENKWQRKWASQFMWYVLIWCFKCFQVLHYSSVQVNPVKDGDAYYLNHRDLPRLINPIEAKLGKFLSESLFLKRIKKNVNHVYLF